MKKYSRLYWAALLLICTVIPFLFFGKLQKSEALRFFESFVDPSELVVDENGLVQYSYSYNYSFPQGVGFELKYADRLEFDPNKKVSIDNITNHPVGFQFDATASPNSILFFPEAGCLLLKYMDGVWYQTSICSYTVDPPYFHPGLTTPVLYFPSVFLDYAGFYHDLSPAPYYTLPSGRYYLFITTSRPTEETGEIIGHGSAMLEIELVNLDGEIKRFIRRPKIYIDGNARTDVDAFPKYSVKVLGETLYHDPYA